MYDMLSDQQITRMLLFEVGGEDDVKVREMVDIYWNAEAARTTRHLRYLYVKRALLMMQLGRAAGAVDIAINSTDVKGSQFSANFRELLKQVTNEIISLDPTFDPNSTPSNAIQSQQMTSWWSYNSS